MAALLSTCSLAWWDCGHMLVALIAKMEIEQYEPELNEYLDKFYETIRPYTDPAVGTFVESATWPDDIKNFGMNFFNKWHFIDRPLDDPDVASAHEEFDSEKEDLLYGMNQSISILTNTSTPHFVYEKIMMLRLLIHLIGDLHQPLHASTHYSKEDPKGDIGGNKLIVEWKGRKMNLHKFWDSGAGELPEPSRPLTSEGKEQLDKIAKELMGKWPRSKVKDYLDVTNFEKWTYQMFFEAKQFIYQPLIDEHTTIIKPGYQEQAWNLIGQNLALAGYRLRDLLVTTFKDVIPHWKAQQTPKRGLRQKPQKIMF
jgi:hypothetical protein